MKESSPSIQARFELILPYIKLIEGWGYGNLNFDAVFKWANIMYEFHKFFGDSPKSLKILDIGGGLDHSIYILRNLVSSQVLI